MGQSSIVKKYSEDIWGTVISKEKRTRIARELVTLFREKRRRWKKAFAYRIDINKPAKRRKRLSLYGQALMRRRKLCLFYGGISGGELKQIVLGIRNIKRSKKITIVSVLERRLSVLVFRMHFTTSLLQARKFVMNGKIMVNSQVITYPNFLVKVGDIIEVVDVYKEEVYNYCIEGIKDGAFFFGISKYLEINYNILVGILIKQPEQNEIVYPFKIKTKMIEDLRTSRDI